MNIIAVLACKIHGHKRGKRIGAVDAGVMEFRCPRCGMSWTRKVKANVKPA